MLKLRLKRVGRKHDPSFRIVVTESSTPVKGKYLEAVGFYNPRLKELTLDKDRAKHWIDNGAQPTDVVHNILVKEGVIDAPKIPVHSNKPSKKKAAEAEAKEKEAPKEEASEEPKEETPADEPKEETPAEEPAKEDKKEEAEAAPAEEEKKEETTEEEKPEEENSKE